MAAKLFQESGGTPQEREAERDRIITQIENLVGLMTERESNFLSQIQDGPITPKQLFWLRDIKEKYL